MAVFIHTANPSGLLTAIKRLIELGHIRTWACDADGDFTHTPEQWKGKAWLRPVADAGVLKLSLVGNQQIPVTPAIYGVFHGRFIEEILAHFGKDITSANATP